MNIAVLLLALLTVEDGLAVLEAGRELDEVPRQVAREAARRIGDDTDPDRLRALSLIARSGEQTAALAESLAHVVARGGKGRDAALEELGLLPPEDVRAVTVQLGPERVRWLLQLLAGDGAGPAQVRGAILLVAPQAAPSDLADLVRAWSDDDHVASARCVLEELARTNDPLACHRALSELELSAPLIPAAEATLMTLVARDPAVVDRTIAQVDAWETGPCAVVLRSLGAIPLADEARWSRAAFVLCGVLASFDEAGIEEQVATIRAASDLLIPELLPLLPSLVAAGRPTAVRVAALEACALLSYRDRPTIDLLIGLLGDAEPPVSNTAYQALLRKSGEKLPAEPEMWRRWRDAAGLPVAPPEPDAERLAKERGLRAELVRRRVRAPQQLARAHVGQRNETAHAPERAAPPVVAVAPAPARVAQRTSRGWLGLLPVVALVGAAYTLRPREVKVPETRRTRRMLVGRSVARTLSEQVALKQEARIAGVTVADAEVAYTARDLRQLEESAERFMDGLAALREAESASAAEEVACAPAA